MVKKPATKGKAAAKKPAAKKAAPKAPRSLTPMQRLFVLEYIKDFNGTRAAIAAGFSEKTAPQQAYQLLHIPLVRDQIEKEIGERVERTKVDTDWVLMRLKREAEADLAEIYDDDGHLLPVKQWPKIWRQGLIAGIETVSFTGGEEEEEAADVEVELEPQGHGGALKRAKKAGAYIHKVKLADRGKVIDRLGRHVDVQAWKDRKEVSADEPLRKLAEQIAGHSIRPQNEQEGA